MLVLWGAFIVSIMVAVLKNIISMDQRELKVLTLVKKLEKKKEIRLAAVNFIKHIWRHKYPKYRQAKDKDYVCPLVDNDKYTKKLKKYEKVLFRLTKEAQSICEEDDVYEDIDREF